MGDYLSHPETTKHSDDGEGEGVSATHVSVLTHVLRCAMVPVGCRDGARPWKTPTLRDLNLPKACLSSAYLTATEVSSLS